MSQASFHYTWGYLGPLPVEPGMPPRQCFRDFPEGTVGPGAGIEKDGCPQYNTVRRKWLRNVAEIGNICW